MKVLGIDTSNYTTSVSLGGIGGYTHARTILEVGRGERGLRQSDALFLHTKNLPELFEKLGSVSGLDAVAVSDRPRDEEGSYMPCFLSGVAAATAAAAAANVKLFRFSHQAGHIMAAVMTCGNRSITDGEFLCFHVSGGTTELLLCRESETRGFKVKIVGGTKDISAGQLVDRTGVLLGMKFPCGRELEALASGAERQRTRVPFDGAFCNISGAENQVMKKLDAGEAKENVAGYALDYCASALIGSVKNARIEHGEGIPVLFAGGVMSNSRIRERVTKELPGVFFGKPELCSDNAVGTAWLGVRELLKEEKRG